MITQTFKRNEVKYIISKEQFMIMYPTIMQYMDYDPYCQGGNSYKIHNLYFDTDDDLIIRKSLSKPYYKEKLRLRSYSLLTSKEDMVFLELKKKIGQVVSKRRAILPYNQALILGTSGVISYANNYKDLQVSKEIACFSKTYDVYPKVYLGYERVAFAGLNQPDLRISFDWNVIGRRKDISLLKGDSGSRILDRDKFIMEIKCGDAMPLWLTSLLSANKIYKRSFSKYGEEYKRYLLIGEQSVC